MDSSNTKKLEKIAMISGVLFAVYAVAALIFPGGLIYNLRIYAFTDFVRIVFVLLNILSFGALAAVMLTKQRNQYTFYALCAFGAVAVLWFLLGFFTYSYVNYDWASGIYILSFWKILLALLELVMKLSFVLIGICEFSELLPQLKDKARQFWYAPAAVAVVTCVLEVIYIFFSALFDYGLSLYTFSSIIQSIIYYVVIGAAMLLACIWFMQKEVDVPLDKIAEVAGETLANDGGYIDLVKHTLLLVFTLGIWNLFWVYRTTGYLNKDQSDKPRDPVVSLLLYIFIPYYSVYWTYKSAKRISTLQASKGIDSQLTAVASILAVFCPIVAVVIMQDAINTYVVGDTSNAQPVLAPATTGYCDLIQHSLLLFFLGGLWNLFWVYRTTDYLNRANTGSNRDPIASTLLFFFVPFYSIYWMYKSTQRVCKIQDAKQSNVIEIVPTVALSVFAPIVGYVVLQDAINKID